MTSPNMTHLNIDQYYAGIFQITLPSDINQTSGFVIWWIIQTIGLPYN